MKGITFLTEPVLHVPVFEHCISRKFYYLNLVAYIRFFSLKTKKKKKGINFSHYEIFTNTILSL